METGEQLTGEEEAKVFLSYSRKDRERAQVIAERLRAPFRRLQGHRRHSSDRGVERAAGAANRGSGHDRLPPLPPLRDV